MMRDGWKGGFGCGKIGIRALACHASRGLSEELQHPLLLLVSSCQKCDSRCRVADLTFITLSAHASLQLPLGKFAFMQIRAYFESPPNTRLQRLEARASHLCPVSLIA